MPGTEEANPLPLSGLQRVSLRCEWLNLRWDDDSVMRLEVRKMMLYYLDFWEGLFEIWVLGKSGIVHRDFMVLVGWIESWQQKDWF